MKIFFSLKVWAKKCGCTLYIHKSALYMAKYIKFWNHEVLVLQLCSVFLRLFRILDHLHFRIYILGSPVISPKKKRKAIRILIGISLNLYINFSSIAILRILSSNSWTQNTFPCIRFINYSFNNIFCFQGKSFAVLYEIFSWIFCSF